MEKIISFGKIAYNSNRKENEVTLELSLNEKEKGIVFSCCCYVWNRIHTDIVAGGQCLDELVPFFKHNKLFMEIHKLWKQYHLNDMHAGTEKQENCLKKYCIQQKCCMPSYNKQCEILKENNLLDDGGYRYGSAWLFREIPETELNRIKEIINE